MTTAIDTNIIVALWNEDDTLNTLAHSALDAALGRGGLVIAAPVFAELLASPGRSESFLDLFCRETGISVDWDLNEVIWRTAGWAFRIYAAGRRKQRDSGPRRILADFLVGAHALHMGYRLMTLDERLYRAAFPRLSLVSV
ncbi:MAG: type II toxin-antitoxin system VapC family toxin [Candidatus Acidiferrales bacterium]